jgi:hypothetical protein
VPLARLALGGALLLAGACSLAKGALHALLSSKSQFCLLVSNEQAPSSSLELGISLGEGADCACVEAFDIHTGQVRAIKIYNDEHDTSGQDKVFSVLVYTGCGEPLQGLVLSLVAERQRHKWQGRLSCSSLPPHGR